MGWQTLRVRESEFAFDPDRELASLWAALADKGIKPGATTESGTSGWVPVTLPDDNGTSEEEQ